LLSQTAGLGPTYTFICDAEARRGRAKYRQFVPPVDQQGGAVVAQTLHRAACHSANLSTDQSRTDPVPFDLKM
jgi:hypothetical protein